MGTAHGVITPGETAASASWLPWQLLLFAGACAAWLPLFGAEMVRSGTIPEAPVTWFALPLLVLLAVNAAWGLQRKGMNTACPAGLGLILGSALDLLLDPPGAAAATTLRTLAVMQGAAGALLIVLQPPKFEAIRRWLATEPDGSGAPSDTLGAHAGLNARLPSPADLVARKVLRTALNAVRAVAFVQISLLLVYFISLLFSPDTRDDPGYFSFVAGITAVLMIPEFLILRRWIRSLGPIRPLTGPRLMLLVSSPALLALVIDGSPAPGPTALAALLCLLGAVRYLRARRRMTVARAATPSAGGAARPDIYAPTAAIDAPVGSPAKPWSTAEMWLAYPVFPVLLFGFSLLFGLPLVLAGVDEAMLLLGWMEAELLVLWAIGLYLVRRRGLPWSILGIRPFPVRSLLVIPLTLIVVTAAVGIYSEVLLPLLPAVEAYQSSLDPYVEASAPTIVLLFLELVVMAPVVEELLFRGFFFTGFRAYIGPVAAAVVSAVLFSLAHAFPIFSPFSLNIHPGQALGALLIGLLLAGLRHDTDSVIPGMLAHGVWNLTVMMMTI